MFSDVDDIQTWSSQIDVYRILGVKDSSSKFTGTISRLLDNVGLKLKTLIQSSLKDIEANNKLSGCALCYL